MGFLAKNAKNPKIIHSHLPIIHYQMLPFYHIHPYWWGLTETSLLVLHRENVLAPHISRLALSEKSK